MYMLKRSGRGAAGWYWAIPRIPFNPGAVRRLRLRDIIRPPSPCYDTSGSGSGGENQDGADMVEELLRYWLAFGS
jgi:hypothetical protein